MSEQIAMARTTDDAAAGGVLIKLLLFSLLLGIVPLSSYFGSLKYVWNGNSTYAAITAVFSAHIVLVAYIISSLLEDRQPKSATASQQPPLETKKRQ